MTSSGYGNNRLYAGLFYVLAAYCLYAYQVMQTEATQPASSYHSLQSHRLLYILVICLSTLQKEISRTFLEAAPLRTYVLWRINSSENQKDLDMPNSQHWRDLRKHWNSTIPSFKGGTFE